MPPRSNGCFQCRKRKIRCDESRPGCDRCAKHGVPCPGYRREQGGFEFEDQTVITVRRAQGSKALVSRTSSNCSSPKATPVTPTTAASRLALQTWSAISPPTTLNSPAATQAQLYSKWLNIYTPETCGNQGLHFDYLREAIGLAESEPALRDGINTLALVQVGHAHNDERLLAASVPSYGRALASLARAVSKATSVRDNTVLAAASLLVVCEFYDKIKTAGISWFGHVDGVQQLLLSRGPDSLDTDLSLILYCNARHGSLARSYLLRKADSYDTPEWRAAAFRAPMQDWSMQLFDMTIQVPRLLQRSDELDLQSSLALEHTSQLLDDCEKLEGQFRAWYRGLQNKAAILGVSPYKLEPIENFQVFSSLVPNRTLTTSYRFTNFMTGYLHAQYWISMHYLRTTIKDLRELRQSFDPSIRPDLSQAVTDEELNGYAFDLCRCIPHFVEPECGTQGHIGIFLPLAVSLMHFRNRQNWKWCKWGLDVKEHVFTMGLRQPHVEQKDLSVTLARPRSGMTPFHDPGAGLWHRETFPSVTKVDCSVFREPDSVAFVADDYADVDLNVDWGDKLPGFAMAVQGLAGEGC